MSSDYNYSKVFLDLVAGMEKVMLDLEALLENHPICNGTLVSALKEIEDQAQQNNTNQDNTKQDKTEQELDTTTEQNNTELGNNPQDKPNAKRKRSCPEE